ncbi:hypothetical protein SEA_PUPPER_170 [Gordonia phage Pupper]|uniref:Uncharacterized protein n=1 Tax=Gordonia phage Pupper TaxID=2571249 RepID=A0A4Y6EIU6_9CAUD|nr:minor tail protein [Gordonia phage Pupper]QDF18656.1 hypothetical protein SEA_PUPPER_170 [Gordonia phage Pupper]QDF18888.1 hypothetical protein SEA_SCENTAE_169 [Gordonia phage SCentae]
MPVLSYVGANAVDDRDVERRVNAEAVLQSGISRSWVDAQVNAAATPLATKTFVDTRDNQYTTPNYVAQRDALLVPLSSKGQVGGVATLDANGKIPVEQTPILGAGLLRGPYGEDGAMGNTATDTPVKVVDVFEGPLGVQGFPLIFMVVRLKSNGGRPVIEIRMGGATNTTYASQTTLLARGVGREYFNSDQIISVLPVPTAQSMGQDGTPLAYDPGSPRLIQGWIYDEGGATTTADSGFVYSSALYLTRTGL